MRAGGNAAISGLAVPPVVNEMARVKVSCSKPLLANGDSDREDDNDDAEDCDYELDRAMCCDPRLVRMRWEGGLVMVSVIVKDAPGGQGLPGVSLTQSPTKLVIEALGTKITISSPPELVNKDGFAAACSDVNSVKELRSHLRRLDGHVEEHARGGDESLRLVDNLREKRLVLTQVGEILKDDYRHLPALGGVWMAAFHTPEVRRDSDEWITGSAIPTLEFRVLMRRRRLSEEGGLLVEEDPLYASEAAAAARKAASESAVAAFVSDDSDGGGREGGIETAQDYLAAVGDQIYDAHVREVVKGALDGVVQQIMINGRKAADLRDVVMWRAEESKRQRLKGRGVGKPSSRIFSLVGEDSDEYQ